MVMSYFFLYILLFHPSTCPLFQWLHFCTLKNPLEHSLPFCTCLLSLCPSSYPWRYLFTLTWNSCSVWLVISATPARGVSFLLFKMLILLKWYFLPLSSYSFGILCCPGPVIRVWEKGNNMKPSLFSPTGSLCLEVGTQDRGASGLAV